MLKLLIQQTNKFDKISNGVKKGEEFIAFSRALQSGVKNSLDLGFPTL